MIERSPLVGLKRWEDETSTNKLTMHDYRSNALVISCSADLCSISRCDRNQEHTSDTMHRCMKFRIQQLPTKASLIFPVSFFSLWRANCKCRDGLAQQQRSPPRFSRNSNDVLRLLSSCIPACAPSTHPWILIGRVSSVDGDVKSKHWALCNRALVPHQFLVRDPPC